MTFLVRVLAADSDVHRAYTMGAMGMIQLLRNLSKNIKFKYIQVVYQYETLSDLYNRTYTSNAQVN